MKKGDRVRIITKQYENQANAPHFGICGQIITDISVGGLFLVSRDNHSQLHAIWYFPEDLEPEDDQRQFMDPDFTLDEILTAQELMK